MMPWYSYLFSSLIVILSASSSAFCSVLLAEQDDKTAEICRGGSIEFKCTTTSLHGFLEWQIDENMYYFDDQAEEGATIHPTNTTTLKLDTKRSYTGAHVYVSTAVLENVRQTVTVRCADSDMFKMNTLEFKEPSKPRMAFRNCKFDNKKVKLSWKEPRSAQECCEMYKVKIMGQQDIVTRNKYAEVYINNETTILSVHCWNQAVGLLGPGREILVEAGIIFESVTVGPISTSNNSITYQITWTIKKPPSSSQIPCIPEANAYVTCHLSSTDRPLSANIIGAGTAHCNVGLKDRVTGATVRLRNSAGFSNSRYAAVADLAALQARLALSSVADNQEYIVGPVWGFLVGVICSTIITAVVGIIIVFFYCRKRNIRRKIQ